MGSKRMTQPQELMATFVACAAAVAVATLLMTERQGSDWVWVPVGAGAVTLGVALRHVLERRRRDRPMRR